MQKIWPLLVTADYILKNRLYVGLDAGYTLISHKTAVFSFSTGAAFATDDGLALTPKVGMELNKFHVETRYSVLGNQYLTLLIGFRLKPIKIF